MAPQLASTTLPLWDFAFTRVGTSETQYIRTIDNLMASRISLKLQLQGIHFTNANPSLLHGGGHGYGTYNGGSGIGNSYGLNSVHSAGGGSNIGNGGNNVGSLILRCTAQIGDLYQEYKEIELGTPQKDPVPARVTLSSGSSMTNFFSSYFSSSSRRYPPPTTAAMLLMAIASIIATTPAATTTKMVLAVVELCITTFAFFNQMSVCAHKFCRSICVEQQHKERAQKQKQQLKSLQVQQIPQQSEKLHHDKQNESWHHLLLPNQLQLVQNYARQEQQCMHSVTSYLAVSEPMFANR
ncbi:uncharacterized protein LOC128854931 [Anastrepha ludens]|uniref:uncharacterized protein LOC128854931 n=1 Tax=Anastrepha ludens TaxID=28586 RepID=UPI0023AFF5B0|nr:uncharacterized protein LOC128854931 [Anastrepha ludens]